MFRQELNRYKQYLHKLYNDRGLTSDLIPYLRDLEDALARSENAGRMLNVDTAVQALVRVFAQRQVPPRQGPRGGWDGPRDGPRDNWGGGGGYGQDRRGDRGYYQGGYPPQDYYGDRRGPGGPGGGWGRDSWGQPGGPRRWDSHRDEMPPSHEKRPYEENVRGNANRGDEPVVSQPATPKPAFTDDFLKTCVFCARNYSNHSNHHLFCFLDRMLYLFLLCMKPCP